MSARNSSSVNWLHFVFFASASSRKMSGVLVVLHFSQMHGTNVSPSADGNCLNADDLLRKEFVKIFLTR